MGDESNINRMNTPTAQSMRVLMVQFPGNPVCLDDRALLELNPETVTAVDSLPQALQLMKDQHFDYILCDVSNLSRLDEAIQTPKASTILSAIGQSVCVIDRDGRITWSNQEFSNLSDEIHAKISDCVREAFELIHQRPADAEIPQQPHRVSLSTSGDRYYDLIVAPVVQVDHQVHEIAVILADVTSARRLQRRINTVDRAGRELVRLDAQQLAKLDFSERLRMLEDKIVDYIQGLMHFNNFGIWILDSRTRKLETLINYKLPDHVIDLDLYAATEGHGICGYVAATGRSYVCPDVLRDPRYLPGLRNARSSLTVPLWLHDQVRGVLNVESAEPNTFTEDDRQFAEIFGRYIAVALNTFDLLATERVTATGATASNVESEISAPLNDIITDATTLMEDYIGHDSLLRRLRSIMDNVAKVKSAVRGVTETTSGLLASARGTRTVDPIMAGKKVLVADDEEAIRITISEVLSNYGCDVETARDGAEAISMINDRFYDVILSDIRMPGFSGYEVFSAARDRSLKCAVILMTGFGYDPNHSIIRARREGLSAVLFKPFKVDQLMDELRQAVQSVSA